ncbi:MAG: YhdP family protein [Gammaproteobacteria bacterium]
MNAPDESSTRKRPTRLLHSRPWRLVRWPFLVLALLGVLVVAGTHGLAAWLAANPQHMEVWLARTLGQPLSIGRVESSWTGADLRLRVLDVAILDHPGGERLMRFGELGVDLAVWRSLLALDPRIDELEVSGARLWVRRHEDRSISVAGLENLPSGASEGSARLAAVAWMQRLPRVRLRDIEVHWRDDRRRAGLPPLPFTVTQLSLGNLGDGHRLRGALMPPPRFGGALSLALDLDGDLFSSQWSGTGRLSLENMNLGAWLSDRDVLGTKVHGGRLNLDLSARWEQAALVQLSGDTDLSGLMLAPTDAADVPTGSGRSGEAPDIHALSGKFEWRLEDDHWRLNIEPMDIVGASGPWPEGRLALTGRTTESDGELALSLELDHARLDDLVGLALHSQRLSEGMRATLIGIRPRASVHDLRLSLEGPVKAPHYGVKARIEDIHSDRYGEIPGLRGGVVQLSANSDGGSADLSSEDLNVDFGDLFRAPLELGQVRGRVLWQRGEQGWRVETDNLDLRNADASARVRLRGLFPPDGRPHLDVTGRLWDGDGTATPRYLPVAIMPELTTRWLSNAFKAGRVTEGSFMLRGDPADFPFDNGKGHFEVRFHATDGELHYWDGWPRITDAEADVVFINRSLWVHGRRARLWDGVLEQVEVHIPDLDNAVLSIKGQASGPLKDMQRFVNESPLREEIGPGLNRLDFSGEGVLDLAVTLPLDTLETEIDGRLELLSARATLLKPRIPFSRVRGEVRFDRRSVRADRIDAVLRERPVRITLSPGQTAGALDIGMSARMSAARLLGEGAEGLDQWLSGEPLWNIAVRTSGSGAAARTRVRIRSDLREATLNLPPPLGKPPAQPLELNLQLKVSDEVPGPVDVTLGNDLRARLRLQQDDEAFTLRAAGVHVNNGAPPLPDAGLVLRGRFDAIDLDPFLDLIAAGDGGAPIMPVSLVELWAGELTVFGRIAHDTHLIARPEGDSWSVGLQGRQVSGEVHLPGTPSRERPVQVSFERLHLGGGASSGARSYSTTDPRDLPPMLMSVGQFRFGDMDLGSLTLDAVPTEDGLQVRLLDIQSDDTDMRAWGSWLFDGERHRSEFDVDLVSRDLEGTLERLAIDGGLEAESANLHLEAAWDAPPMDFTFDKMNGDMSVAVKEGRMMDVDPGAGRILGLISLPGLTRRVRGDFTDLTEKGFAFNSISGDVSIVGGVAHTENLSVDGPAAQVNISGDMDLRNQTYDQVMDVIPGVSSTFPIAGALVGGTGVGAVVLLAQKLLEKDLNKLAKRQYRITGPWNEPLIEPYVEPDDGPDGGDDDKTVDTGSMLDAAND